MESQGESPALQGGEDVKAVLWREYVRVHIIFGCE